jgi:hypothetical protein
MRGGRPATRPTMWNASGAIERASSRVHSLMSTPRSVSSTPPSSRIPCVPSHQNARRPSSALAVPTTTCPSAVTPQAVLSKAPRGRSPLPASISISPSTQRTAHEARDSLKITETGDHAVAFTTRSLPTDQRQAVSGTRRGAGPPSGYRSACAPRHGRGHAPKPPWALHAPCGTAWPRQRCVVLGHPRGRSRAFQGECRPGGANGGRRGDG